MRAQVGNKPNFNLGRTIRLLVLLAAGLLFSGCLGERSFPMNPARIVRLDPARVAPKGQRLNTRQWTAAAHAASEALLPADQSAALTTDQLSSGGRVIDVWKHFAINPGHVDSMFYSLDGIEETAQVTSPPPKIGNDGHIQRKAWEGFHEVDVPVSGGAMLYGLLAPPATPPTSTTPHDAAPKDFVILTHGLFGSMDGLDLENNAQALRLNGHYVLAIEMRGHGETQLRHPEYGITFGVRESDDLLRTAQWLKQTQGAMRVGLISYSLTGFEALLAAWLDGHTAVPDFPDSPLLGHMPQPGAEPAFNGGMIIISAPLDVAAVADRFDPPYALLEAPVKESFQRRIFDRITSYQQTPTSTMWGFVEREFARTGMLAQYPSFADLKHDLNRFEDLHSDDDWRRGAQRMENIRHPVLILSAANDPLATAQQVAELFGRVRNPNIGVVLLRDGGHMGMTALSADYYYSMVLNFFDPRTGPAAVN